MSTADSVNATRSPGARISLLSGQFHQVECPHCGLRTHVDRTFLYTDIKRSQFVHVFPRAEIAEWPRLEDVAGEVFYGAWRGPPAIVEIATQFRVRAVFGLGGLTDKLRIWNAGLDDALVELLKLELYGSTEALRGLSDLWLVVCAFTDEHIEVEASSAGGTRRDYYGMSRRRYRELEAARPELVEKFPGLFHKPFVSFLRMARETVTV